MFSSCFSIISLPDISHWENNKVRNLKNLSNDEIIYHLTKLCNDSKKMNNYNLLSPSPYLLKWNPNKSSNIMNMFSFISPFEGY